MLDFYIIKLTLELCSFPDEVKDDLNHVICFFLKKEIVIGVRKHVILSPKIKHYVIINFVD